MSDLEQAASVDLAAGLGKVRGRRWLLWFIILAYVPGLLIAFELNLATNIMGWLFALWVLLLCVVVGFATVVKCPRCAKAFHTSGPTFLPVRQCVHCGLHLNADKIAARGEGP